MPRVDTIRDFSKVGDQAPVPNLIALQTESYARFLQADVDPDKRRNEGLESLLQEVFPIVSYDESMTLEYIHYELGVPRYNPQECRDLRLTYGMPFRIRCRLTCKDRKDVWEESIYVGEIPIMLGGGEFIINGAERVIVSQLHRSPGVDFTVEMQESDRPLHGARVIPERGSWIELSVTKKDAISMRIDQSSKIPATMFLRSMDEKFGDTPTIIREFYETETVDAEQLRPQVYLVEGWVDPDSGEEIVPAGGQVGDALNQIVAAAKKKIEIVSADADPLILNTLAEDPAEDHEAAVLRIYARLRPGNPPQMEKAKVLFDEKFYDENRYRLGKVGRFRINRKFGQNVDERVMTLRVEDFIGTMQYLLTLRNGEGGVDDIDHLGNRRLRTIDELGADEMRKGFLKLRRTVQERMSLKDPDDISKIAEIVNSKSISSSIDYFFGRGELSQVVDQQNPLSQLTNERRLSALGPGGLNRKRAGFEVRDVHISHYGRICPIETPEGNNIGLISSMGIYAGVDEYGFLTTPYMEVKGGKATGNVVHLRADEEVEAVLAPPNVLEKTGRGEAKRLPKDSRVLARVSGELSISDSNDVGYLDISPKQTVGVSASLIPFLEHDDANRALMGSNMQRQGVPLMCTDAPLVATGMERSVVENSGFVVKARKNGTVTYVDAHRIVLDNSDEYELRKFGKLNERACLNQKPIVAEGDKVKKGQIIADGSACSQGELALGRNVLVAFMPFDGYNFEDAILISQKVVKEDAFTSVHLEEYEVEIRETKLGREEFTRDIPNVSEKALRYLDEYGVVQVGTHVGPGDILVGKVSPKSKSELSPEEKLLHAIFGRAGEDVKNDSLELPAGEEGVVVDTQRFSRRMNMTDVQKKQQKKEMKAYETEMQARICKVFRKMAEDINDVLSEPMVDKTTLQKVGQSDMDEVVMEQVENFTTKWFKGSADAKKKAEKIYRQYWQSIEGLKVEMQRKLEHMKRGDELPSGVLEMVKVRVATKRKLGVGDKMAGRHGNKGVIARILPEEDMPFLDDGTPVEIVLNPLGVPGRMNLGQILETHLGWAAAVLGFQAITPVFDGATEAEIFEAIKEANEHVAQRKADLDVVHKAGETGELLATMPLDGKVRLCDGRTGEPFEQKTTVGYIYMNKLHHLVDEKIHARATGPYSLITQQPLGGKARTGGQRFGEMEVWGLEAYGASYTLQELLTVKSDDVEGRTKIYESMVKGQNTLEAGTPVSFDVLCNELRGLGLNIHLEKKKLI
ncbi:MAG: DNA-directed RNA polymerase subunit beta [Planctomycetes bacterium]|nr:DNA-directed RNA polymerase subunit beta [Phycisphaerae bacterium]NBB96057.1 DNA-directed RNA polymerase subunit beta [Planctomycetota bacterium]